MATYSATNYTKKPAISHGLAGNVKVARAEVSCTSAPSTSDTLNFFYLPAGARVHLAVLEATDMDTNVTPTLTLNIGDSGDAGRLFAASTVAQTGAVSSAIAAAGADATYTSETLITGTAQANAATGAAGTVYLTVFYTVEGAAS